MPPYVSVVLPTLGEPDCLAKLLLPIDALAVLEQRNSRWAWSPDLDDIVQEPNKESMRKHLNFGGPSVKMTDATWDLRGWDAS